MVEEATLALQERFPDASSIRVQLIRDLPWTPDRMSEEGRRQLGLS
jgi:metal-sulfur cluster biosynthetic enzyme